MEMLGRRSTAVKQDWIEQNRVYENARHNSIRKANPDRTKSTWLKCMYGITLEQYAELLLKQDNKCCGCGAEFGNTKMTKGYVDHDHQTDQVRGLLCHSCNLIIGYAEDNPETLEKLISYLNK